MAGETKPAANGRRFDHANVEARDAGQRTEVIALRFCAQACSS
jgi:hypothetical protein